VRRSRFLRRSKIQIDMKRLFIFSTILVWMFSTFCPSLEAQWPVDPAENMQLLINAINPVMVSDGFGGAIVVAPVLVSYPYLVSQRVDRDGYILWDKSLNGIEVAQKEDLDITGAAQLLPDGHGGVFVAYNYCSFIGWIEEPPGPEFEYDVYVQHIDSSATVLWGDRGVPVCTLAGNQIVEGIVTDAEGGMIVIWTNGGTHAQRLSGEGEILWEENGEFVSSNILDLVVTDGMGGAILIPWLGPGGQRIDGDGEMLWNEEEIDPDVGISKEIASDGKGNIIFSGSKRINGGIFLVVQKMNNNGNLLWQEGGVIISPEVDTQTAISKIAADMSEGTVFTWRDTRTGDLNVYAQRVNELGEVEWEDGGILISSHESRKTDSEITTGDSTGVMCVWLDYRNDKWDLYGQKLDSLGGKIWAEDDVTISIRDETSWDHQIISDSDGGAIVAWYETGWERGTFVQKVYRNGTLGGTKGDVNLDGTINILDVVRVVNIILSNPPPPTEYELWSADFIEDGEINIQDIIGIINRILGLDPR